MDTIFELATAETHTASLLAQHHTEVCIKISADAIKPDLFSSLMYLEEYLIQTWVANFGRRRAQRGSPRTLAVHLVKTNSELWDGNCSIFCHHLRGQGKDMADVGHYAVKYHYLRPTSGALPSTVNVTMALMTHAKLRATNMKSASLPYSNIIARHLLRTCRCMDGTGVRYANGDPPASDRG